MRGSGQQGLKLKFADKLHPSAPLTTTESSRLLTALTSSFRKHLDEAHPTPQQADNGKKIKKKTSSPSGESRIEPHAFASSASFTQKHMSSVLTNPLFISGGAGSNHNIKGYVSAKTELESASSRDPIELFEEYDEEGAADFRVAELCLRHAMERCKALRPDHANAYVQQAQPGSKILSWLLNSSLHDATQYADNNDFLKQMTRFLLAEKREYLFWHWMSLDLPAGQSIGSALRSSARVRKSNAYRYRWRSHLLSSLVTAKAWSYPQIESVVTIEGLNAALDAFAYATTLGSGGSHIFYLPLGQAAGYLNYLLTTTKASADDRHRGLPEQEPLAASVDIQRYEKFMTSVPLWSRSESLGRDMALALLELFHPRRPSADRAYGLVLEALADHPSAEASAFLSHIKECSVRRSKYWQQWTLLARRTVAHLQEQQLFDEVVHITELLQREFPGLVRDSDRQFVRPLSPEDQSLKLVEPPDLAHQSSANEDEREADTTRLPYPAFG